MKSIRTIGEALALALTLGACTTAVARRQEDVSGQASPSTEAAGEKARIVVDCDRESRRYWTPSWRGGDNFSRADIDWSFQRMFFRRCLEQRARQSP